MKVLLVEDNERVAQFVLKGLAEAGHSIDHAGNGSAGRLASVNGTSVEAGKKNRARWQESQRIGIKVGPGALRGTGSLTARAGARERSDEEYPAHPHGKGSQFRLQDWAGAHKNECGMWRGNVECAWSASSVRDWSSD